jgi:hypothetical protein
MSTTKYKGRTIEIIATKRGFYARVSVIETSPENTPVFFSAARAVWEAQQVIDRESRDEGDSKPLV